MKYELLKKHAESLEKKRRQKSDKRGLFGKRIECEECGERLTTLFYEGGSDYAGLIVTIHGGGFLYNGVYDEDGYCRYICESTGYNVASLDYTLTYKRQYPAQLNQCDGQIKRLIRSGAHRGGKIALIGHSAGANLAAALTLKSLREREYEISALCLNYPDLDNSKKGGERKFYPFTFMNSTLDTFSEFYCGDEEGRRDPLVSPLLASDAELAKFPPTYIVEAKGDRLGEDAEKMYERLTALEVEAELVKAKMRHGFIEDGMRRKGGRMNEHAKETTDATLVWLKNALSCGEDKK